MRNTFLLFIITVLISSCGNKKEGNQTENSEVKISKSISEFRITKDTFNFTIDGHLNNVVFFRDKYYCMFEMNEENPSRTFKKMVLLSEKGELIEEVPVPNGIEVMNYYDIKIENDSLYIKREQFDKENYLLDEYANLFIKVPTKQFKLYDDKEYTVYSNCNGEFGGTIFFLDKETKLKYEGSSTCPIIINRIGTEYYITNYLAHDGEIANVIKISNPKNLEKSDWNFNSDLGSIKTKGIKKLLDNTSLYISTSFVYNQKLLHIYSDWNKTYIGRIENEKMKMIYEFDFNFYSQLNQVTDNGKQILNFMTPNNKEKGILIIEENNLKFKFLH
jgi:hypothetical protein